MSEGTRAWESFYVIVGSSAGALTGLQFVVLTLIAESGGSRRRKAAISAFGTPNVVHFCAALLVSAIFSAPWGGLGPVGVASGLCGVAGVIYSLVVLRRSIRQREYKPVLEDFIWHAALPTLAYAALIYSGFALAHESAGTLYVVGAATLLLVFIGIHNAWDTILYLVVEGVPGPEPAAAPPVSAPTVSAPTRSATPAAPEAAKEGEPKGWGGLDMGTRPEHY